MRGTPQQIIDKYNQLARDAQLANDRVATENFQQHAEHYMRLLSEAQREQEQRREQQERENRERQAQRDRERAENSQNSDDSQPQSDGQPQSAEQGNDQPRQNNRRNNRNQNKAAADQDVMDLSESDDSNIVDTPENASNFDAEAKPKAKRKPRKKPAPKSEDGEAGSDAAPSEPVADADAAE